MTRLTSLSFTLLAACAASDYDLDREAAQDEESTDGKADGISFTRLERATSAEVAASFGQLRGAELVECFAGYQAKIDAAATQLTKPIADKFIQVAIKTDDAACAEWSDLHDIVYGVLDARGVDAAAPATVVAAMPGWAKPQLSASTTNGFVDVEKAPLLFYSDIKRVEERNARARESNPAGIDLGAIRASWDDVQNTTTLDRAYLNPVTFPPGSLEGSQLFKSLRAAFPLRHLTLQSIAYSAISDFASADEGPENDPAFAPIAKALKKSSIKKRFFYAGSGDGWSSHVLIVIDEHGQVFGMQMGYSE